MLWVNKVYINHRDNYPQDELCYSALKGFALLGLETAPFYGFGDIDEIDLHDDTMVVGFVGDVRAAIKRLGHPPPDTPDYPTELNEFLGRRIYSAKLGNVRGMTEKVFIKPKKHKLFTGHVRQGLAHDEIRIAPYDDNEDVWLSDPVNLVSEYRCFIMCGELIGMRWYKGSPFCPVNRDVVHRATAAWHSAPAACTLDFGLTRDNKTVLIEANDGFAFGSYGLPPITYARMLEARWREMVGAPPAPPLAPIEGQRYR